LGELVIGDIIEQLSMNGNQISGMKFFLRIQSSRLIAIFIGELRNSVNSDQLTISNEDGIVIKILRPPAFVLSIGVEHRAVRPACQSRMLRTDSHQGKSIGLQQSL